MVLPFLGNIGTAGESRESLNLETVTLAKEKSMTSFILLVPQVILKLEKCYKRLPVPVSYYYYSFVVVVSLLLLLVAVVFRWGWRFEVKVYEATQT